MTHYLVSGSPLCGERGYPRRGQRPRVTPEMSADIVDLDMLMVAAARAALPQLKRRGLRFAYDCRLPFSRVTTDAKPLLGSLQRLLDAARELMHNGMVVFDAEGRVCGGRLATRVMIAAGGRPVTESALREVLRRLDLQVEGGTDTRLRRAKGRCPRTDAEVQAMALRGEGVLFKMRHVTPLAPGAEPMTRPSAQAARAWLIDPDAAAAQVLARRLHRLGWVTSHFDSSNAALVQLRSMPRAHARPALVVNALPAKADATAFGRLAALLPPASRCVLAELPNAQLAVPPGERTPDRHALPFSEGDLIQFTAALRPAPVPRAQEEAADV